jgi:hypothetical protein
MFTGSTATGRVIGERRPHPDRLLPRARRPNPMTVPEDANLGEVVPAIVGVFGNTGQICIHIEGCTCLSRSTTSPRHGLARITRPRRPELSGNS